jgi:hypothetical protein
MTCINSKFDINVGQVCFGKIITNIKYERSNLNAMINALKYVVSCECLGLETSFQQSYFGHVFFQGIPI